MKSKIICIIALNVRDKTTKLLVENLEENLGGFGLGKDFFNRTQKKYKVNAIKILNTIL